MSIDPAIARDVLMDASGVVAMAYGGTMVVRTIVAGVGRWLGVFPPEWFEKFCWLPWRPTAACWFKLRDWWMERHHGDKATAGFAGLVERMTIPYRQGLTYVGRMRVFGIGTLMPCGVSGRGATLILGKARSGKSAHLIARVSQWAGNVFAFDVDGTLTHVLARRLGKGGGSIIGKGGGKFCCLDPNGHMKGTLETARYNVFEDMRRACERDPNAAVRWADRMAEALIVEDNHSQPYFAQSSRAFVKALILYVHVHGQTRTMVEVRELLTRGLHEGLEEGQNAHDALFTAMENAPEFGGIIARGGSLGRQGKTKDGRNLSLGTALSQTSWLDDPAIAHICSGSDFSFAEMKTADLNLSLVAPVSEMRGRLAPWYRLMLGAALYMAETVPGRGKKPTLYVLDEWCAINMVSLQDMPAVYPKYGVACLFAAQELTQIQAVYEKNWETFINNADTVMFLATESQATIDYLHRKLGVCTRRFKAAPAMKGQKARYEHRERPVMMPDDIRRFLAPGKDNVIVTRAGERPLKLKNGVYFRESSVWQADPDPQYGEPFQRRWARRHVEKFLAWRNRERPMAAEPATGMEA